LTYLFLVVFFFVRDEKVAEVVGVVHPLRSEINK
jgi:hypothetical protein